MNRDEFISSLNLKGIGLEVGVQSGNYSKVILERSQLHLILLDSWRYIEGYIDMANVPTETHLYYMNNALKTLSHFEGRFTLIRETSEKAVGFFKDELFDFIYLDANHSEKYMNEELIRWWPKVNTAGVFSGHDYCNIQGDLADFGVKTAVDNFCRKNNLELNVIDGPFSTWFIHKL